MIDQLCIFFFNDTATTEIYTLSLHDALPISAHLGRGRGAAPVAPVEPAGQGAGLLPAAVRPALRRRARGPVLRLARSEEHTSELQSRQYLVCRLLLEKK